MTGAAARVRHGGSGGAYVRGCRCADCTEANTARIKRRKYERFAERVEVDGRLVAVNAAKHGIKSTYGNWGCRCQPCTEANARFSKAYRVARAATGVVG